MRRTASWSSPDGHSASEPSPSLRTATAAQPPPQIASRFLCLLRRRCPLTSARARRRGGPWDRWSGLRPPFRSRSRTALLGPVRRSPALTSPCTWCWRRRVGRKKKNDTPHLLGTSSNDLSSPSLSLKSYTNWTVSSDNKYNSPLLVLSIFIVSQTVTLNVFRSVLFCFKQK